MNLLLQTAGALQSPQIAQIEQRHDCAPCRRCCQDRYCQKTFIHVVVADNQIPDDVRQHWRDVWGDGHDHAVGDDLQSPLLLWMEVSSCTEGIIQSPEDGDIADDDDGQRYDVHKHGPGAVAQLNDDYGYRPLNRRDDPDSGSHEEPGSQTLPGAVGHGMDNSQVAVQTDASSEERSSHQVQGVQKIAQHLDRVDVPQEEVAQPKRDKNQEDQVHDGEVEHEDVVGGDGGPRSVSLEQLPENSNTCRTPDQRAESAERSPDYDALYHVSAVSRLGLWRLAEVGG